MAAVNFPSSPTIGQEFTSNGKTWVWSGSKWVAQIPPVLSVAGRTGDVVLTSTDVGLGNVNNTSDASKSVASAATLTTSRSISLTGDVTGTVNFNGSSDVSILSTIVDDSHNHVIANIDGLQTALDSKQALDADLTAIGALIGTSGLLRKTAANTWALDTAAYSTTTGTVTSVSGTGSYNGLTLSGTVTGSGNITLGGTPTGTWPISVTGNAGTVTNGVYTTGNQTIAGVKTFSASPVVPTLAADTNSTQVASTAFVFNERSNTATLSNKTITALREVRSVVAANDIDLSLGNIFTRTITGPTTFTVSNVPSAGTSVSFILDLTNGGSSSVAWWTGVRWANGVAPILTSSGRDVLGFFTHDAGANWTGVVLGRDVR